MKEIECSIRMMAVEEVHPYENNPRINKDAVKDVATSIKKYGFKQPIVIDKDGVIVVGHTRYQAALQLGYKIMKKGAKMFLSCPNTPGNGYDTQYRAHVYEWGYDELKTALYQLGFTIRQEVGLVMGAREMNEHYAQQSPEIQAFYNTMKAYVPTAWLTAMMSIPFPKASKEVLFICEK